MGEKVRLGNKDNTKQTKISTPSAHSASAHSELVLMLKHNSTYTLQHTDIVMT